MVDVDPLGLYPERDQSVALGGEVLLIGGASGVPDKQCAHVAPPNGVGPAAPPDADGSGVGPRPDLTSYGLPFPARKYRELDNYFHRPVFVIRY